MSNSFIDLENMPSMDDLFGNQPQEDVSRKPTSQLVTGRVVHKLDNGILLDVNGKSEPFVPAQDLGDKWESIQVGDDLEVSLETGDEDSDMPHVDLRKAELQKSWDAIEQNYKEGDLIRGTIRSRVKGGLIVDVNNVEAFLPGSQVDLGTIRDLNEFIGKEEEFKILKINAERRNIVLSRRELLEADRAEKRAARLRPPARRGKPDSALWRRRTDPA